MTNKHSDKLFLSEKLGLSVPLFAFSDMPEVVAEVSKAGGLGVLGAVMSSAEEFERRLTWLDEELGDIPYGVDIVITAGGHDKAHAASQKAAEEAIPQQHWEFVEKLLASHGVPPLAEGEGRAETRAVGLAVDKETAAQVDIALAHKTRVLVNALGPCPQAVVDRCHQQDVLVGGLVGAASHVKAQLATGVDFLIAQGSEAGGHCGEVTTMVLVPEVVDAVAGRVPVLGAGGIASGSQVLGVLALGASGAWTGSMWLTSNEAAPYIPPIVQDKLLRAGSTDTVRSRAMSGKPMRQLRTAWTEAWEENEDSPGCLPAPLQGVIHHSTSPRFYNNPKAAALSGYPVGQIVGKMSSVRPVAEIVGEVRQQIETSMARLNRLHDGGKKT